MSSKIAEKVQPTVVVADVVRSGEKLLIPEQMTLSDAVSAIQRQMRYEEEYIRFNESLPYLPMDGAIALQKAMVEVFGFAFLEGVKTMFGQMDAQEMKIPCGVDQYVTVPWGLLPIPGSDGGDDAVSTGVARDARGMAVFNVSGRFRRKFRPAVDRVIARTREILANESIYRGKALKIQFLDNDGDSIGMVTPEFLDVTKLDERSLIYRRSLEAHIENFILTPIRDPEAVRRLGIPLKRGILLPGEYGTGKTLLAFRIAKLATVENPTHKRWTFLYLNTPDELPHAIRFAQAYGPTVIYAEDIDRAVSGGRTHKMDEILNTLDGIDSKHSEIVVVLTTNHLEDINRAMLRPGRLDVVLEITPPDAEAVERLIRWYGRSVLSPTVRLDGVSKMLAGKIPAVIREVVERAKLAFVARTRNQPTTALALTESDLLSAAESMLEQLRLCNTEPVVEADPIGDFGRAISTRVTTYLNDAVDKKLQEY